MMLYTIIYNKKCLETSIKHILNNLIHLKHNFYAVLSA